MAGVEVEEEEEEGGGGPPSWPGWEEGGDRHRTMVIVVSGGVEGGVGSFFLPSLPVPIRSDWAAIRSTGLLPPLGWWWSGAPGMGGKQDTHHHGLLSPPTTASSSLVVGVGRGRGHGVMLHDDFCVLAPRIILPFPLSSRNKAMPLKLVEGKGDVPLTIHHLSDPPPSRRTINRAWIAHLVHPARDRIKNPTRWCSRPSLPQGLWGVGVEEGRGCIASC